jgi:AcrR family transcriptional regulator
MPKQVRAAGEVAAVKHTILETALDLMCEVGFDAMSMRKLAVKLNMTAANIYNYYKNKDELYLAIQTEGFRILADRLAAVAGTCETPVVKIRNMMEAYLDFGKNNPDYYDIMFTRNTPKFADYKSTPMEAAATVEKQTALSVADIATRAILELRSEGNTLSDDDAGYLTILTWSTLHGLVNLYNSRVLQETTDHADRFINRLLDDLINRFFQYP